MRNVKLVKLLKSIVTEAEDPSELAHKLDLKSGGFGRWVDDTGETVAKTVDGNLVKIDPNEKQDSTDVPSQSTAPSRNSDVSNAPKPPMDPGTRINQSETIAKTLVSKFSTNQNIRNISQMGEIITLPDDNVDAESVSNMLKSYVPDISDEDRPKMADMIVKVRERYPQLIRPKPEKPKTVDPNAFSERFSYILYSKGPKAEEIVKKAAQSGNADELDALAREAYISPSVIRQMKDAFNEMLA